MYVRRKWSGSGVKVVMYEEMRLQPSRMNHVFGVLAPVHTTSAVVVAVGRRQPPGAKECRDL